MQYEILQNSIRPLEKMIQQDMTNMFYQERLTWFQWSKAKWLVDANKNTIYYHVKETQRRRKNIITMLRDGHED